MAQHKVETQSSYKPNRKPGFVAVCSCGWRSPVVSSAGLAGAAGTAHIEETASA